MPLFGLQVFSVTPTIWCVRRRSYFTCSYIVQTRAGVVLVDAGMDSRGEDMIHGLAQAGFTPKDIHALLFTHWHNDHSAGGHVLQEMTGAPTFYHTAEAPFFTRATAQSGFRGMLGDLIPEWGLFVLFKGLLGEAVPEAITATTHLHGGETVLEDFEVIPTPGHTDGHVSYYYRPERALFSGDALAVVGTELRFMARPVTLDHARARESMLRCLEKDIALICPGHREPLTEGVPEQAKKMSDYIRAGGPWPFFG